MVPLILGTLKALGVFPYSVSKERTDQDKHIVIVRGSHLMSVWSYALVIILLSCCIFGTALIPKFPEETSSILAGIFAWFIVVTPVPLQFHLIRSSKLLAQVVQSVEQLTTQNKNISLRFFVVFIVIDLVMIFFMILGVISLSQVVDAHGVAFVSLFVILLSITQPINSLTTYGLLYPIASRLALELDTRMQWYLDNFVLPDLGVRRVSTQHSMPIENPNLSRLECHGTSSSTRIIQRTYWTTLDNDNGQSRINTGYEKPGKHLMEATEELCDFIRQVDGIIESFMSYESALVMIFTLQYLIASVFYLYSMLTDISLPIGLYAFQILSKVLFTLGSPDSFIRKKEFWTNEFRRRAGSATDFHKSEIVHQMERVLCLLETGPTFSPYGLFTMGRGCLIPVLSTILTYIIIALQFKISEDGGGGCAENNSTFADSLLN